jgi:endonuclease I
MKQTAVEWLVNMLEMQGTITPLDINQAKAMEKEQIIEAYLKNHLQGCWMKNTPEEYAEQYYNETYESNT